MRKPKKLITDWQEGWLVDAPTKPRKVMYRSSKDHPAMAEVVNDVLWVWSRLHKTYANAVKYHNIKCRAMASVYTKAIIRHVERALADVLGPTKPLDDGSNP